MQYNGENHSVLLIRNNWAHIESGKMLRSLNNKTQSDHISSFSMLLWWFVYSETNNVNGVKNQWLCIAECFYKSSLGRNYCFSMNVLLLPEWWWLHVCPFSLLSKHYSFQGCGVRRSKRLQLRNGAVIYT